MEEKHNYPVLISAKCLKQEFKHLQEININSNRFSIGRSLQNSLVIPFIAISRSHCIFKEGKDNEWIIEDCSSLGIKINGQLLGKGKVSKVNNNDVISLEPSEEFVYKFHYQTDYEESPRKRIKLEKDVEDNIIYDVKVRFEESQSFEMKHIQDKINNTKQMQKSTYILKQKLQQDMDRKIKELEEEFAGQIENLKGEKNEVECQKTRLIEERDAQLAAVKVEMEGKISELMEQIQKHNETETELLEENSLLKEKLLKEREAFLAELNRETSSKQDMLEKLEAKIKEQEETRLRERHELENALKKETEELRVAKEKELKELEEQKVLREHELQQEMDNIRKNLQDQMEQTEQQKLQMEQLLKEKMEEMKKLSDTEKIKMEELVNERECIQKQLDEAQKKAEKSLEELKKREIELAALAADRIQKQAEQSGEVITTLQEQLERVREQLQSVETEKNNLLESICNEKDAESTSSQATLSKVTDLMDSELQCGICTELFISATTLNCSHTFCKFCIVTWKKKKNDCPICRAPITSENKSLVLDSFIDKMAFLSEEAKQKRKEMILYREAEMRACQGQSRATPATRRGSRRRNTTTTTTGRTRTGTTAATTSIPTVDLTWTPAQMSMIVPVNQLRPVPPASQTPRHGTPTSASSAPLTSTPLRWTLPVPARLLAPAAALATLTTTQMIARIVQTATNETNTSPAGRVVTTAATGVVTTAAVADTGPPAAHSSPTTP